MITAPETIEVCFHQLFERQAELWPQHPAIICGEQQLTYGELNARSNQLAHHLRALGAGPETLIPVCVERSAEMAVSILGILKAGAAYVPVDPDYPAERIAFMLADTAAPLIVTQSHIAARLSPCQAQLVLMDADAPLIDRHSTENPALNVGPENAAYVIYTSGSTGQPKGMLLTQSNLSHYVLALQDEVQLTRQDRYLHLASIAFSSSRRHLMLPLAHGATVVIATPDERLDALLLFRLMKRRGVTVFDAVPSFQRHCTLTLLDLPDEARRELLDNQVRLMLSASEPLLSDVPQTWRRIFQHPAHHIHMLGQTETSGIITLHHLTEADYDQIRIVPAGRPLARTRIFLLDENQQPVPDGEPGEICVSSAGVGRGYLNRPELTAQKFINWSMVNGQWSVAQTTDNGQRTTDNGQRLCRTGDFARRLPDGTLECLGRQDSQIKIRGHRVEPGEIEALLVSHPDVRECAVAPRMDERGQARLVAYVVTQQSPQAVISELRRTLKEQLPDYLRPAAYVPLAALPLTPNGKIDRRALPEPDEPADERSQPYVAPRIETERVIAEIWAEVLGVRQPGIHDHFLELGGHSLLAGQVINRLRAVFQTEIPLRALFESPTIAGLAGRVEEALQSGTSTTMTPLVRAEERSAWPLSFAQRRLWFLDQLEPGTATYNLRRIVRIDGPLNVAALRRAWQTIIDRHDILRTTFTASDGQPSQIIAPALTIELPLTDLSNTPQSEREAERLAMETAAQPFDLQRGPLLRGRLLRLSDETHYLAVVFHHIISDGWSLGIFFRELGALYQAFASAQPAALPPLEIQYADYALWQQQQLQGHRLAEHLAFWRQHLAGAPALLELPTDFPRPAVQRYQGAQLSSHLPTALRDELQALSQREGVTLFMTLLAAFQTLLQRYSQQDQIVTGTPTAGRTTSETEALIGFFVNTLALRGDLSGDPTFQELLARTRQRALGAYAHQELPFERLVEELQPVRSLSYSPVFQVMFALQNAPAAESEQGALKFSTVRIPGTAARFDLSLDVYEETDGLTVRLEYDTDLFEAATAERVLAHFRTLLEAVASNPAQHLSALPLLADGERRQLLHDWNRRQVAVPPLCLHQLFEAGAAAAPHAIAVICGDERITYGELNARSNQLAHFLIKAGVGPETMVGVCVERSPEMIVALLGVLKAGGAYVPLDPNYPAERLKHMLSEAAPPVLLTQAHLKSQISNLKSELQMICLDADWPLIAQESAAQPESAVTSDNLAYVIFTSGSTGKSKGVLVTHGNVVNAWAAWEEAYQLSSLRCHLQMANFSFDVFTGDLTRALCSGASLVLCPTELLLDPERLLQLINTTEVEAAEFVPAVIRPLLEYLERTGQRLQRMKLMVVGSDMWQMDEYERLRRVCGPHTRVISSYGVTEATIDSTFFEATENSRSGPVPIGRPFANTQIFILDAQQQPVPVGVSGELYIGGAGVTRGYLNRADLTAQKFISWSVVSGQWSVVSSNGQRTTDNGQRLYRTGDLARYRVDGLIELLGRADQQVKLRGYRIEPAEIEAALALHPAVQAVAVVAREDEPGDKRLVAYLVPRTAQTEPGELRRFLKDQLPDYMIPSAFVRLETLPLTPNGKLDRRALPKPDETGLERRSDYVAPRTRVEEKTADILAGLLKLERIGVNDNFFELGGHSLLATQVVSRIRDAFHIEMPLRVIFESPVVSGLAAWITHAITSGQARPSAQLRTVAERRASPQSFAQQRLWFLDQFDPGNGVYNLPSVVRFTGRLDLQALESSLNAIIRRHEILHTTFSMQDGEPVQVVMPPFELRPELTDLTALPAETREAEAIRLAADEALRPFDLSCGPLLRAHLWRLAEDEHLFAVVFHHIISDGWSLGIFFRELGALYQPFASAQPAALPPLEIQYADYALWQQQQLQGHRLAEHLAFWRQHLAGAPALTGLPTDFPRPAVQRNRGAQLSEMFPAELSRDLRLLSQREGVTLFMTLLAAFQTLLQRYSQQDQIVTGTPTAGRTTSETEALIGFFVNTLALRGDLSGDPTFQELLARTRQRALGAYAHQELPFERLVEELQPVRSLSYSPVFQVMFALQNGPVAESDWAGLKLHPVRLPGRTAKFDLSLDVSEQAEGLRVWFEYDTDLFAAETIAQMMAHYRLLLENIARDSQLRLSELLPVLPENRAWHRGPAMPGDEERVRETTCVAPRTATEEMVAELYAGLLKRREISVNDDFFELGGHSLLAARVVFRLRELFGVNLSLRSIFEAPTVAGLATVIDQMLAESEERELDALLAELESLSEDEAQRLLLEESRRTERC
ncbi:MAG: amino acid adenylation domain-containing protein [Blastocatellia bacterium]